MRTCLHIFSFLIILLSVASCTDSKIQEGQVQYELSYPYMDEESFAHAISPKEMSIIFKGTKMRTTIKKGKLFETNIISDESNEYLALYSDLDGDQI